MATLGNKCRFHAIDVSEIVSELATCLHVPTLGICPSVI